MFFKWIDSYSVGNETIDYQHKKLIEIINKLYSSFVDQNTNDIMENLLEELIDYTIYHFDTEKKILVNYPSSISKGHLQEHQNFVDKVTDFKKKFSENRAPLTARLTNFLRDWLIKHIMISDRCYLDISKYMS